MTKVVSYIKHKNDDILLNHQRYCQSLDYDHEWVEYRFISHSKMCLAYKYNVLLEKLSTLKEDGLLMMLDDHSAVMNNLSLEQLMAGIESLVIEGPAEVGKPDIIYANMIILRNTPSMRQKLMNVLVELHKIIAGLNGPAEEELLKQFNIVNSFSMLNEVFINLSWRVTSWYTFKIFVVNLGAPASYDERGQIIHHAFHQITHDTNLEHLILKQINAHLFHGKPMLELPSYPAISEEAESHFNPNSKIALVTLYTHHINTYARISEHNLKRYCDRHGYAYHVYREIPEELNSNMMGSWAKFWLIQKHFANHEWIIWVDADILFRNQNIKLESILNEREILFAKDMCAWPINAGIMGFKNTPSNLALIMRFWERIKAVSDKSSVYSDQGDQHYTIIEMYESSLVGEPSITDLLTINTPPMLSDSMTFTTHYMGLNDPYRSVYMATHDQESQRWFGETEQTISDKVYFKCQ